MIKTQLINRFTRCSACVLYTLFFFQCQVNYNDGKFVYEKACMACHGSDGRGLNALIPPLAGSDWLTQPHLRDQIPCAIRNGMQGKVLVNGIAYDGVMQAFPKMSDVDINNVMNYISKQWGNTADPFLIPHTRALLKECE